MYFLQKTDPILLFDGGENELENEWLFTSESGKQISVSVDRFIDCPLNLLEKHLSETDFRQLITGLTARKSEGISGNYCNRHGLELYWLRKEPATDQPLVIVSFGEVNAGRYRLVVEGEISEVSVV